MTIAERTLRCVTEADTSALGRRIGAALAAGDLLLLSGPLGAGKTVLVRGIAAGLGIEPQRVRSPTFVIHHVYRGGRLLLHHLDLYRLGPDVDLRVLDLESLVDGDAAVAVEWAERSRFRGFDAISIAIDAAAAEERDIALRSDAPPRIAAAWSQGARR